jgi:predicted secreted hydrolase
MFYLLLLLISSTYISGFNVEAEQREFECPKDNGRVIYPPKDFNLHPKFEIEWQYLTGNLMILNDQDDKNRYLGYQITTFVNNIENNSISDFGISLPGNSDYYGISELGNVTFEEPFQYSFNSSQLDISYFGVTNTLGEVNSKYHFTAKTSKVTLDLYVVQTSPYMLNGHRGYYGLNVPNNCIGYYYWSLPSLLTEGTITYNQQIYQVIGKSWFDHQYGSKIGNHSLISLRLHLDIGNVLIIIPRSNGKNLYLYSIVEFQKPNGFVIHGSVLSFTPKTTWTSSRSNITYPSTVVLITDVVEIFDLYVKPLRLDQEMINYENKIYWEGNIEITRNFLDNSGAGYMELVGF